MCTASSPDASSAMAKSAQRKHLTSEPSVSNIREPVSPSVQTGFFLHRATLRHRSFYTQGFLRREVFIQTGFYTQKLLHREKSLHGGVFTHRIFYTLKSLH